MFLSWRDLSIIKVTHKMGNSIVNDKKFLIFQSLLSFFNSGILKMIHITFYHLWKSMAIAYRLQAYVLSLKKIVVAP